jgi:hypothetical protein
MAKSSTTSGKQTPKAIPNAAPVQAAKKKTPAQVAAAKKRKKLREANTEIKVLAKQLAAAEARKARLK